MLIKETIIKMLGGYTEKDYQRKCSEYSNSFDEISEDDIKIGDKVYFYYVSRFDYQSSKYHEGVVRGISNYETSSGLSTTYTVECTDSKRFADYLKMGIKDIAHTRRKLRDKIVNSTEWTFLSYMEHEFMEQRIPRNEKFKKDIE